MVLCRTLKLNSLVTYGFNEDREGIEQLKWIWDLCCVYLYFICTQLCTVSPKQLEIHQFLLTFNLVNLCLSRQKAHIFSLKLTRFIRTMDTFLCLESQTLIYCQPRFTDTGYLHTVYFHCHNYVIIVDIVPCSNNDIFLRVNSILLLKKR